MASGITYICSGCKHSIETWSDGNPYFLSYKGTPQYFYHPDGEQVLESYKMKYMYDALNAIADELQSPMLVDMLKFEFKTLGRIRTPEKQDLSRTIDMVRSMLSSSPPVTISIPEYDNLNERTGNMVDMLCLDCGREFRRDMERQKAVCPSRKCKSAHITPTWELDGRECPKCRRGVFKEDESVRAIS